MKNHIEAIVFNTSDFEPSSTTTSTTTTVHSFGKKGGNNDGNDTNETTGGMVLVRRERLLSYEDEEELARKVNELYLSNDEEGVVVDAEDDGDGYTTSPCRGRGRPCPAKMKETDYVDDDDEKTYGTFSTTSINTSLFDDENDAAVYEADHPTTMPTIHIRVPRCHNHQQQQQNFHQRTQNSDLASHYHLHPAAAAAITAATAGNPLSAYSLSQNHHRHYNNSSNNKNLGRNYHYHKNRHQGGEEPSTTSSPTQPLPDFLKNLKLKTTSSNPRKNLPIQAIPLPPDLAWDGKDMEEREDGNVDETGAGRLIKESVSSSENCHLQSFVPVNVVPVDTDDADISNTRVDNDYNFTCNSPSNNNNNNLEVNTDPRQQLRKSLSLSGLFGKSCGRKDRNDMHRRINSTPPRVPYSPLGYFLHWGGGNIRAGGDCSPPNKRHNLKNNEDRDGNEGRRLSRTKSLPHLSNDVPRKTTAAASFPTKLLSLFLRRHPRHEHRN